MAYEIPTEEVENIRKNEIGVIGLQDLVPRYEYNIPDTYNDKKYQISLRWYFNRDYNKLSITSFNGDKSSRRQDFELLFEIIISIAKIKGVKKNFRKYFNIFFEKNSSNDWI